MEHLEAAIALVRQVLKSWKGSDIVEHPSLCARVEF